jgi:nucleotide-binding universal stress UspA family protein
MSYKELFVHLDSTERSDDRLEVALEIARRFDASVSALYAECDPFLANLASQNVHQMFADSAARARSLFDEKASGAGVSAYWETSISRRDSALTKAVAFGARHCDLAILGQHDPSEEQSGVPADLVEQVVIHTGRPSLVVPRSGRPHGIGRRIMIGWNAGREAVRAVHDALPFLQSAEEVALVSINPRQEDRGHGAVPGADMARHLEAHGVHAKVETREIEGMSPMETLLSQGAEKGADLLVVGAHGHYGFPDLLRGSGTKHLLRHMTIPVLMSH